MFEEDVLEEVSTPTESQTSNETQPPKEQKITVEPPFRSGELLEDLSNELIDAKWRFACACYYSMLAEGLTWKDIIIPLTGRLGREEDKEVSAAFENLLQAVKKHDLPNLMEDFLVDSRYYGKQMP